MIGGHRVYYYTGVGVLAPEKLLLFDSRLEFEFFQQFVERDFLRGDARFHPEFTITRGVRVMADFWLRDGRVVDVKPWPRTLEGWNRYRQTRKWRDFSRNSKLVKASHGLDIIPLAFDPKSSEMLDLREEYRQPPPRRRRPQHIKKGAPR